MALSEPSLYYRTWMIVSPEMNTDSNSIAGRLRIQSADRFLAWTASSMGRYEGKSDTRKIGRAAYIDENPPAAPGRQPPR